jgi:predicted Na+-dependent transporter
MEPGTSILLVLGASVVMTVAALGLGTSLRDAMYVFRRPAQLSRSLLSMIVVMPVVAAAMVAAFDLHPAVARP